MDKKICVIFNFTKSQTMQNKLTLTDKLNHIKNLFILGKSDCVLDEKEIQIISEIAIHHQLTIKEISYILNEKSELDFSLPETFIARLSLLYDLVLLMVTDLKIHQNEKEICLDLAKKFEFNPHIINELTDDILNFTLNGKECDEAMQYLIKYAHPKANLN